MSKCRRLANCSVAISIIAILPRCTGPWQRVCIVFLFMPRQLRMAHINSAGTLTKLFDDLTSCVTAIYTNQNKARNKWMVPDEKPLKIAALMTKVQSLMLPSMSNTKSTFTPNSTLESKSFHSNCTPWCYVHQGNEVTRDGKDWCWCGHPLHKRDGTCTYGMYCCTHGKGQLKGSNILMRTLKTTRSMIMYIQSWVGHCWSLLNLSQNLHWSLTENSTWEQQLTHKRWSKSCHLSYIKIFWLLNL